VALDSSVNHCVSCAGGGGYGADYTSFAAESY